MVSIGYGTTGYLQVQLLTKATKESSVQAGMVGCFEGHRPMKIGWETFLFLLRQAQSE
jgi:hypothetical protein